MTSHACAIRNAATDVVAGGPHRRTPPSSVGVPVTVTVLVVVWVTVVVQVNVHTSSSRFSKMLVGVSRRPFTFWSPATYTTGPQVSSLIRDDTSASGTSPVLRTW